MEMVDPPSAEVQTPHNVPKDCFYHACKYDFPHHGVFRVCLQDLGPSEVVEILEDVLEDCYSMCTVHSPKMVFFSQGSNRVGLQEDALEKVNEKAPNPDESTEDSYSNQWFQ